MAKFSTVGVITLSSICIHTSIIAVLEALVISFHVSFVSNFVLNTQGIGVSEADLIYHALFIFSLIFQLILVVDALLHRNTIQVISLVVFNLLALAYAGIQLYQHMILEDVGTDGAEWKPKTDRFADAQEAKDFFRSKMRPLEYIIISLCAFYSLLFAFLSYKLAKEFGWENYKTYSADVNIRNAYVALNIMQTLIKLDVFFILSYAVQLIPSRNIGYSDSIVETVLIFAIGPSMMVIAWYATVKEQKYVMLAVVNMLVFSGGYLVYRLIRVNIKRKPEESDPFQFTRRFLTFFLLTTFCLVLATIVYGIICFRNMMAGTYVLTVFGKEDEHDNDLAEAGYAEFGLKSPKEKKESKRQSRIEENRKSQQLGRRLSLD